MIKASLAYGGRRIKRKMTRTAARTRRATVRTLNAVGKVLRIDARKALAKQLGVPPATIRKVEKAQAAFKGSKVPRYTIRWIAEGLPVRRSRFTKFEPYRGARGAGQAKRGRLLTLHWRGGKRVTFEGVIKVGRGRGAGFALPETATRDERGVGGTKVSRNSRPSRLALDPIRKTIPRRFKAEFRRQLRRR